MSLHAESRTDPGELLARGGENGALLRALDWSTCGLGPPHTWPAPWRFALRLMLDSALPIALMLGRDELWYFHNDAYIPIAGARHPRCVGRPVREVWASIFESFVEPRCREVFAQRKPVLEVRTRVELEAQGLPEERFFSFEYCPLPDADGTVIGVFVTAVEVTTTVLTERRLDCMRQLAARAFAAGTASEACGVAGEVLATASADCPGALVYLIDPRTNRATLAAAPSIDASQRALIPALVELERGSRTDDALGIGEVLRTRSAVSVPRLAERVGAPAGTPALALPILDPEGEQVAGVLIALVTPLRPLAEMRDFVQMVAGQLSTAIANARAREHALERANALAALDRAKTTFFSNVSHELRTPLTLLLGPLQQVLASGRLVEDDRALLELARRGGSRLQKLIKSLLDFTRLEVGRVDAHYEPIDLARFTKETASMFASAFETAGLRFVVDAPSLPAPVYVDREMWEKIVLNLLSNALKFTLEGQVRLRLRADGESACLEVSDTGCGIAQEHLGRIFERFHRVVATRARTQEGAGIGLSLVRELARLHGGTVSVQSELDRGTTMCVRVPFGSAHLPAERVGARHQASSTFAQLFRDEALGWLEPSDAAEFARKPDLQPLEPSPQRETQAKSQRFAAARIVVADDSADMRAYLRRILGEYWDVHAVADGARALALARSELPDLVVADVMMPGLDGFALLAALQRDATTAGIPVLLVSARAGEEAATQALGAGAADYVVKPFSARELVARVQTQLANARLQAAERRARVLADEASRGRERFLAVLAHELRSPLAAVLGWAELLRSGKLEATAAARAHEIIEQNARMLQRLVEDLLDVARIAGGQLNATFERVDTIAPALWSVVDALQLAAKERSITLEASIDPRSGPLLCDRERLRQVLTNLLGNALKFTPAGGSVHVRCARRDGELELSVRDSGRGIAPDALAQIFDEFWMADRGEGRRGGLGLGLAIARSIVLLHGGRLTAQSDGVGRGATFTAFLPLAREETALVSV